MSTCVKIIFHEEGGGVDVRVGYDETPDATETELYYAKAYAQQITEIVRHVAGAEDLTKEEKDHA